MAYTVSAEMRSRIMSKIRSKGTGSKLAARRALQKAGLRYKVHDMTLPGTLDIFNKRLRLAVVR